MQRATTKLQRISELLQPSVKFGSDDSYQKNTNINNKEKSKLDHQSGKNEPNNSSHGIIFKSNKNLNKNEVMSNCQVKAKLQTCLFSLKQIKKQLKSSTHHSNKSTTKSIVKQNRNKNNLYQMLPKLMTSHSQKQNNQNPQAFLNNNNLSLNQTSYSIMNQNLLNRKKSQHQRILNSTAAMMTMSQQSKRNFKTQQFSHSNLILNGRMNNNSKNHRFNQTDFSGFSMINQKSQLLNSNLNASVQKGFYECSSIFQSRDRFSFKKQHPKINQNKLLRTAATQLKDQKKASKVFPPKIIKHLYESAEGKGLPRESRYFPIKPYEVNPSEAQNLGLCQTMNRYGKEQVSQKLRNLSPTIERKQLQFVKVCKQNELFLTRPKDLAPMQLDEFLNQEFVINQARSSNRYNNNSNPSDSYQRKTANNQHNGLNESKNYRQEMKERQRLLKQDQAIQQQQLNQYEDDMMVNNSKDYRCYGAEIDHNTFCLLEIRDYKIVKDQNYQKFYVENIEFWSQIQCLINQLERFIALMKIKLCRFKGNVLLDYWCGKKLTQKDMEYILRVKRVINKNNAVKNIFNIYKAKKQMSAVIRDKQKKHGYMKWVCDRMKGIASIKKQKQYKLQKAYEIHQKLLAGQWDWDVQIYLSSFSQTESLRNSTQYMQSFQNMFTHMWKQSSKHMILIIPTINSDILQLYQDKIKIKRSVTIICPQTHDLFPLNMSLSSCFLYSYEALNRVKRLIQGKKAVLIPGKYYAEPINQLLISEFLRAPLMTSLKPKTDMEFQRNIFVDSKLSILPYTSISPNSTEEEIIRKFSDLVLNYRQINNWIFKINGEFSGRGLATFNIKSSKLLRSILSSCSTIISSTSSASLSSPSSPSIRKPLQQYLKRNLKLKLTVNYENNLFIKGDYLNIMALKGGIIEQMKQNTQVQCYEVSLMIQPNDNSSLISCFRAFNVNYSNKAYIYESVLNRHIARIVPSLKETLERNSYLGYVSVNLALLIGSNNSNDANANGNGNGNNDSCEVYGIEIKPYLTHLSSIQPLIKSIQNKRQMKLMLCGNEAANNNNNNNHISEKNSLPHHNNKNNNDSSSSSSFRRQLKKYNKKQAQIYETNTYNYSSYRYRTNNNNEVNLFQQKKQINQNHNQDQNQDQDYDISAVSNLNLSQSEMMNTLRNNHLTSINNSNSYQYLFIPNIILTDVPVSKKAEFIENLIGQTWKHRKFNILGGNVLYISNGLSLNLLVVGKDMKKLKKDTIEIIRFLNQKASSMKIYCGKNQTRDVFHFGDIIKAVTQIKV